MILPHGFFFAFHMEGSMFFHTEASMVAKHTRYFYISMESSLCFHTDFLNFPHGSFHSSTRLFRWKIKFSFL